MTTDNHTPNTPQFKVCNKCGETLPATTEFFYKKKAGKYGLTYSCKACAREYQREWQKANPDHNYQYREENPEYYRKWREENREHKRKWDETNREHILKYREERREYDRERARKYCEANREVILERNRKWREANPEKARALYRAHAHTRRARKLKNGGTFTPEDVQLQYDSQKGLCWWCGCAVGDKYHVDHVIPLARGGSNAPKNLCISCPKCNLTKNDKLPHEFNGRLF